MRGWMRRDEILLSLEEQAAELLVERYRHEFEIPLTKVVMGLRSIVRTTGSPVYVSQRLKRRPRIAEKLVRHPTMQLSRMQDIAGCRAELPDLGAVGRVHDRLAALGWDLDHVDDYNAKPKTTGYRALHLIVRRDDTAVEIQLRTMLQQRWAAFVEHLDLRYGLALKDGHGPDALVKFYERLAYAQALVDRGMRPPMVDRLELRTLAREAEAWLSQRRTTL
jgi:ppGpp synthetase/RelA/SpoT-type nucleotidyltranferase